MEKTILCKYIFILQLPPGRKFVETEEDKRQIFDESRLRTGLYSKKKFVISVDYNYMC